MIHDFGHKGLNNDFLIKTADPLAVSRRLCVCGGSNPNHGLELKLKPGTRGSECSSFEFCEIGLCCSDRRDLLDREVDTAELELLTAVET